MAIDIFLFSENEEGAFDEEELVQDIYSLVIYWIGQSAGELGILSVNVQACWGINLSRAFTERVSLPL